MNAKNVISECLLKMGLADFSHNETFSEGEQELINSLLGAMNIAYREIICEYLPLTTEENVVFSDGQLMISKLGKSILYPIRLKRGDETVAFKTYPNRLTADFSGEAILEYAYTPPTPISINSSINDVRLTQSALSDGTLAEYYFANKVFDLAKSFDTSFRSKLGLMKYKGRSLRLKERRWRA